MCYIAQFVPLFLRLKITSKNQRKNKSDSDMVYLSVTKEFRDEQEELLKEEQELLIRM